MQHKGIFQRRRWKNRCSLVSNTDLMWKTSVPAYIELRQFHQSPFSCCFSEYKGPASKVRDLYGSVTINIFTRKCLNCFCVWACVVSSRKPPKFEKPALTPPRLCEGRFAGPLQYRVWKSLKGSIYPGLRMIYNEKWS